MGLATHRTAGTRSSSGTPNPSEGTSTRGGVLDPHVSPNRIADSHDIRQLGLSPCESSTRVRVGRVLYMDRLLVVDGACVRVILLRTCARAAS